MFADISIYDFNANSLYYSSDEISQYRLQKNQDFDRKGLTDYLLDGNNLLDGKAIMNNFFPHLEADIFLSHAHSDEDDVIKLAIKLESLGLKVFVDSCIWGYADGLLKKVDNKFCLNESKTSYNYEMRNRTTSNVYMILNSALHKMISKTELLLFLQTNNSLKISNYISDKYYLSSPWIFSELTFASLCERTERRKIKVSGMSSLSQEAMDMAINEEVIFAHEFPKTQYHISNNTFESWLKKPLSHTSNTTYERELSALRKLDELYHNAQIPSEFLLSSRLA